MKTIDSPWPVLGLGRSEDSCLPSPGRAGGGGGGDLVPTMPGCVCPKVKDMGPFSASRE